MFLQILEKDNKEVVNLETDESDTAIFEALCFEKYKMEEIQVLN
ncbi:MULTISPECIES: peptidase [Bacillus]|uniref:Peptidase n=2 Tax=Bacillus cereus group TaxID=86661 RepID=A0A9X8J3D5_BACCE|nr:MULTISPECIES: peptidase [Bacillus]MCX2704565.1 peptidase [Bacillus sp. AS_5]MEB4844016.1 peptidase [Paenibacillus jamilae]KAA0778754.1 peptidase [Bacillus sp. TE8-1]KAB7681060.1 peptidase [Bacillus sp. B1-WWTP-T-0.5-Post-4]MBH0321317.1 peptidase [Bacillus cereus]